MNLTIRLSLSLFMGCLFPSTVTAQSPQLKADWLRQLARRGPAAAAAHSPVTPCQDALGASDGVINGQWGFHTNNEKEPWWQIDLSKVEAIHRMVLYNRTDFAGRAARIRVLTSLDGKTFRQVHQHNGKVFYGHADKKPLVISLGGIETRWLRLQLPGTSYFHLDEVQVFRKTDPEKNIAPGKPATQSSASQWSVNHAETKSATGLGAVTQTIQRGLQLATHLKQAGVSTQDSVRTLEAMADTIRESGKAWTAEEKQALYFKARAAVRRLAFSNPRLDFDTILFVKRAPGTLPHMSDQYYGWWSRPGGGIYLLKDFTTETPKLACLTENWPAGSFLRPDLSYDGKRVLFAYCRHYPHVSGMEKVDKDKLPADAFYNIYEMRLDGTGLRQLTRGRYDDFDARYLPDGRMVFLSTRKGQFIQCTQDNTLTTMAATQPDSYVRCGGDNRRPCAVYTLHTMDADGGDIRPISAFENFEWTPSVASDGRILYARWDYIDRFNGPFMSLWSTNPDGTNPQLVYGNFTKVPQCVFEARSIPGSDKLIFTGAAHHSIMGGTLALLDPDAGTEKIGPITRLTPEVPFPETEAWADSYYANPYPLSEDCYLVSWCDQRLPPHRGSGQVTGHQNPVNATGIYLYDRFGNLTLLHRDPDIASMNPLPVRPRPRPARYAGHDSWTKGRPQSGFFLLQDVNQGLTGIPRGTIKRLRIIGVVPKPQPHMNTPNLSVSREDPGKFIMGTVPVHDDGSAFFRVPSGVPFFFQALDGDGLAVQTMRTLTYVQPGQTLSCIGCHESRNAAPSVATAPKAALHAPARIKPGPSGTWPLHYETLVQPVLNKHCTHCHNQKSDKPKASRFDLTTRHSYQNLISFGGEDLKKLAFEKDYSVAGQCAASQSRLLRILKGGRGHKHLKLDAGSLQRLVTWMDTYAHRTGSFSKAQAEDLRKLRIQWAELLTSAPNKRR